MLLPALLLAAPVLADEPLADKVEREYVKPALEQVQGAVDGREPSWTPPVLPGTASTRRLSEEIESRWIEPLLGAGQGFASGAARTLASPNAFAAPPAEPDAAALLPVSRAPAAEGLVESIERRFLSRLFPEDYAARAAAALGKAADDAGPEAPDVSDLADTGAAAGATRLASPQDFSYAKSRRVADSTRLTRGSGVSSGAPRPRLKPFKSRFSSAP